MSSRSFSWLGAVGLVAVLAVVALGAVLVRGSRDLPDTVQPIAWDRQPCAHCQMLVGEPRSAAQVITLDGDVLAFDDPGCALRYLAAPGARVHRAWFHHAERDAWIPVDEVAFLTGGTTPMGSGLLAVEASRPGAIDLPAALARQARLGSSEGAAHEEHAP